MNTAADNSTPRAVAGERPDGVQIFDGAELEAAHPLASGHRRNDGARSRRNDALVVGDIGAAVTSDNLLLGVNAGGALGHQSLDAKLFVEVACAAP